MNSSNEKPVGLTKDVGFQVGARQSYDVIVEQAWDFLFSKQGLAIWLGKIDPDFLGGNGTFTTPEGVTGRIRLFRPGSHVRLSWRPEHWENDSTVQLRVIAKSEGRCTIAFHQEKMLNEQQREEMKAHWHDVLDELANELTK